MQRGLRGDPYMRDDVWSAVLIFRCGVLKFGHGIVHKPNFGRPCSAQEVATQIMVVGREKLRGLLFFFTSI
jgi:hypothetical protein